MKQMFIDTTLQAEFDANGFVKLPWLGEEDVAELRALYARLAMDAPAGFSTSYVMPDASVKMAVREGILKVFESRLRATFINPAPLMCCFITKTRGDGTSEYVSAHQDWTFVDETEGFGSINVWCPLEPTTHLNGNLCLVPGTNRLRRFPRLAHPCDNPYKAYYDALKQAAVAVPTSLGEALIFDNGMVHYSSANQTDSARLVAAGMVVDRDAKQVLYFQNQGDAATIDEYHSGIEYFIQKPLGARPDTLLRTMPKTELDGVDAEIRALFPHIRMPDLPKPLPPQTDSQAPHSPATEHRPASFLRRAFRRLVG